MGWTAPRSPAGRLHRSLPVLLRRPEDRLAKTISRRFPNGGPGIENRLQLMYHYGVNQGQISLNRFVELTSTTPARIFGMYPKKGEIAPGSDADLVLWDPQAAHVISAKTHHMRVDYSMFEGYAVKGNARTVISRGEVIVDRGKFHGKPGRGQYLKRQARGGAWKWKWRGPPGLRRPERPSPMTRDPSLYNPDLAPIPLARRTWGTYNYASLWVAMSVCIPTYMLASGLIAGGMNWIQAICTILLGNLIVLIPCCSTPTRARSTAFLPGFRARLVRRPRRQYARRAARARRLRMVRHSDVDRRPGYLLHAENPVAGGGRFFQRNLDLFLRFLGAEYRRHLARHRNHQVPRRHRRAVHARHRPAAAVVDHR